ncbi:hypothetical protein ACVI1J_001707 [Bradyrhizobium diazoefficiens]
MADPTDTYDPLYAVARGAQGDVIVRWSELTDAEQQAAWDFHIKTFGAADKESKS